jgi:hypothetical protein
MFIELVDALRCLNEHDESWLVAAVVRFEGRYIDQGSLGCPVCRAEYRIERGAADFRAPGAAGQALEDSGHLRESSAILVDHAEEVLRIRALLDLSEAGGTIALAGQAAALASAIEDEADVNVLAVNPGAASEHRAGRSTLLVRDRIPLARGSLRGAVIGDDQASPAMLSGLASAIRVGGRLVAPAAAPVPFGMEELARDDRQWVAVKRDAASAPVQLGMRRT